LLKCSKNIEAHQGIFLFLEVRFRVYRATFAYTWCMEIMRMMGAFFL